MRYLASGLLAAAVYAAYPAQAAAGLYSPAEPTPFPVKPDGTATDLAVGAEFNGPFAQLLNTRQNELDPNPARAATNADRRKVQERVEAARKKLASARTPAETAALAADLLRLGSVNDALNLLQPLRASRNPDFRVLADLVHAHAFQGAWNEAVNDFAGVMDFDALPGNLAGTTPEQRRWLLKVERKYYSRWLRINQQRSAAKTAPAAEDVLPLFEGVRFVNDAGAYEPGKLAAAEKAKLPPDAVAIVQQLVLWAPWDVSLQWLLAELYAADGRLREAADLFNRWGNSGQYSNRPVFMAHRSAVRTAAAALPPPKTDDLIPTPETADPTPPDAKQEDPNRFLPSTAAVVSGAAVFGLLALALLVMQIRAVGRRLRARRSRG